MNLVRSVSLFALLAAALSVRAADAFSNLAPAPNVYASEGYVIASDLIQGFQFTSGLSGSLTGFQVAMNQLDSANTAFSLSLYADSGSDTLGSLLGTYGGTSTDFSYKATNRALATVAASGPFLSAGGKYWLVASGVETSQLIWSDSYGPNTTLTYQNGTYNANNGQYAAAAFSVQVDPIASVPGPLAALPFALFALQRRKRPRDSAPIHAKAAFPQGRAAYRLSSGTSRAKAENLRSGQV